MELNPIGIIRTPFKTMENDTLMVQGVDVLDNTPLIDIKPYIPRFDCRLSASDGWVAGKSQRVKPAGRE